MDNVPKTRSASFGADLFQATDDIVGNDDAQHVNRRTLPRDLGDDVREWKSRLR
jgi:hypothetical protein